MEREKYIEELEKERKIQQVKITTIISVVLSRKIRTGYHTQFFYGRDAIYDIAKKLTRYDLEREL